MLTFLYVLHFLVCFILIGVVLLQRGKGQDLGASLGGGSANTIFGSRGAGNFLTKITTASAIIFMGTSLSLSYLGYKSSDARLFDQSEPFVPEGVTPPKAADSGLEEVPAGAGAPGSEAGAAADAAGDTGALVEVPTSETPAAAGAADAVGAAADAASAEVAVDPAAASGEAAKPAVPVEPADAAASSAPAVDGAKSEEAKQP